MEKKTSCEYEEAFKGTREMALSAMQKLQLEIKAAKDNDGKDSNKRQLQLVLMVLRTICTVAAKPEGKHYSIYCETLIHVLGKYIQPSVSAKYWTFYLEHVRYLHYIVADKKMDDEAKGYVILL
ncbi:unnamed protein product [Ceratitis capitata]|uniref:(Mediterranean fruit fly) hypothetical protein n=1 Tax=Ceratitis capitata TaxID=7213 RepID=A0A811VGX4_CERCA|nr:unnamed protein product [Ceratitis capitata]